MSTPRLDSLLANIPDNAPHSLIAAHLMTLVKELEGQLAARDAALIYWIGQWNTMRDAYDAMMEREQQRADAAAEAFHGDPKA